MPCPHNEITIVQRSQRQSAVAAAAYQSGEKLFCEYDQQVKHYPEKRGIVHNEILLPANAPPEYADRNTLWNAAEAVEKQWNSQLARRWVLTIPREIPPDLYLIILSFIFCSLLFCAWQSQHLLSLVNTKRVVTVFCEPPSTGVHDWQLPKFWQPLRFLLLLSLLESRYIF